MVCVRIFKTREEAEWAKEVLKEGGFSTFISEDKFNNVPIQEFRVPARFRLNIADEDLNKAAKFLAQKLKNTK